MPKQSPTAAAKPSPGSRKPRVSTALQPTASHQDKEANRAISPRYVTLQEWGATMFSQVPTPNTLMRWARDGHIDPPPRKIGRQWFVKVDAEYVE